MGAHEDLDGDHRADRAAAQDAEREHAGHDHGFCEDRADPDSWDDPDIAFAWADPPEVEAADDVAHLAHPADDGSA